MPQDKPSATIVDWSLHCLGGGYYLRGTVYGHPRRPDGTATRTSKLLRIDCIGNEAETMNTRYVLGRMKE